MLQLDVPVRQVLIEARIVIADDLWGRQLGARFGTQSAFNTNQYNVGVSGTLTDTIQALSGNSPRDPRAWPDYPSGTPGPPGTPVCSASACSTPPIWPFSD